MFPGQLDVFVTPKGGSSYKNLPTASIGVSLLYFHGCPRFPYHDLDLFPTKP